MTIADELAEALDAAAYALEITADYVDDCTSHKATVEGIREDARQARAVLARHAAAKQAEPGLIAKIQEIADRHINAEHYTAEDALNDLSAIRAALARAKP